uniref:Uncharacterized conserved protein, DUF1015 family n=1 Tax=Candidatus Kentrum sp. LPFa TaxID=2126335 RepID=A0A450XVZ4_9GAMM|nr:MAG: Uncharacterized conserved protein, DUF1015 family [Candidatus Kentron sp. LPFa]VFK33443.1 MAG: Uncharacterized conserved protein, DUF1015 family [Candidatus Kentron sp. LPFa]
MPKKNHSNTESSLDPIRPFAALMPTPEYTARVAAPPYDVVSGPEARRLAEGNPWHFLHVSRPEIDFPPDMDPYGDRVYAQGADNLRRMIQAGVLKRRDQPGYYLYELSSGDHVQIGIAAVSSLRAYEEERIRRHELTRPQKENDRVRHIEVLGAQTGPVLLVCPTSDTLTNLLAELRQIPPDLDFEARDGVRHAIRVISDPDKVTAISKHFAGMDSLYIADGHHRSAAAARVAALRRVANGNHTGLEPYNFFLTVIFPEDQLRILDYNRVVRELNGLSRADFLGRVGDVFEMTESDAPIRPTTQGEFGLYLANQWYRLTLSTDRIPRQDPVARLATSLLTDWLLHPILDIRDLRHDQRIDFVGGIRGLRELERLVDEGEMAAAFSLYPTQISELLAVADAGLLMPPKSTWFEPKLADGLLSYELG